MRPRWETQPVTERAPARETLHGETPVEGAMGPNSPRKRVVRGASASPVKPPQPKGPPVPRGWREKFLRHYAKHGTRWRAARVAGVSHDTLERHERADAQFASRVEEARRVFVESLESSPAGGFLEQFRKGNVVAGIVLAKRHDPTNYIERNLSISASFTTELPAEDGKALLHAMLGQGQAPALEGGDALPAHVVDGAPSGAGLAGPSA
jgi:hypothetical protein